MHKLVTKDCVESCPIDAGTENAIVLVGDILEADGNAMVLALAERRTGSQVQVFARVKLPSAYIFDASDPRLIPLSSFATFFYYPAARESLALFDRQGGR